MDGDNIQDSTGAGIGNLVRVPGVKLLPPDYRRAVMKPGLREYLGLKIRLGALDINLEDAFKWEPVNVTL